MTPRTHPAEVVLAAEGAGEYVRARALGDLFGYPRHAVDFFVRASFTQHYAGVKLVPRDFLNLPTFGREKGRFVYAVPKGHAPNAADEAIRAAAEPVLAAYTARRSAYVGDGKPGAAALLRDWHLDGFDTRPSAVVSPAAGGYTQPARPAAPGASPP